MSLSSLSSNLIASLSYTFHQSTLDTNQYPVSSSEINFWHYQSIILLSLWLVLNILVISTWPGGWLVNCIRFNWIIVRFCILTKLLTYTFSLVNILPSLIFVIQKHLISNNFYQENSSLLNGDREMCALREPLGDIGRIEIHYLL